MSKILYRNAVKDDLKSIQSILNYYILHSNDIYDKQARTDSEMLNWWNLKLENSFPIWVAEENSKVIAFASYGSFRRWEGYSTTVEHSIYIQKSSQSKGIGKSLMKLIIEDSKSEGFHTMIGGIDSMNTASIRFHESLGFQRAGLLNEVAFKNETWLDLIFMQKILSN
jgi:phosphinothricin acetyltransferase